MAPSMDGGSDGTPSVPAAYHTAHAPSPTFSRSASSSDSEKEQDRPTRLERPRMGPRKPSGSIIIPRDHPEREIKEEDYPPEDARAMSPRRNSEDLEKLGQETRRALQEQARTLQSSLAALAERIDEVRQDHDKLESENKFLQDYIGGLTRTMSKSELTSSTGSIKRKK